MSGAAARSPVLDGVRGLSIVTVLVAHLLPLNALGPRLNESAGMLGMALFFVLSGYFIGKQVLIQSHPLEFVAKRLLRILPLAWLVAVVVAAIWHFPPSALASHLLFYANLSGPGMRVPLDHFWSLCVELQFYALATLLLFFRPGVARIAVPVLLFAVTAYRVYMSGYSGSITWYRIDDILAGFVLAILLHSPSRREALEFFKRPVVLWIAAALLCLTCYSVDGNFASFVRPYAVLVLTGALMSQPRSAPSVFLSRPFWGYLAAVSFAVYVLHVPLEHTWLGSGDVTEKYLKRPLLLAVIFLLAHLSTFYFERHFIAMGHRVRMSNDPVRSV
jgi:peptidoglycan/LPS O-acetylase OafA/YrhL